MVIEKPGKVEPAEGYGAPRGWKARQYKARMKMAGGKNGEERARIRAARKRHKMEISGLVEAPEKPNPPHPTSGPENVAPQASENPEDMDRDALVAELEADGQKVHPNTKDSTLRRKVEALRGTND